MNPLIQAQEAESAAGSLKALHFYFINGYAISYKFKSEGKSAFRIRADILLNQSDGNSDNEYQNVNTNYSSKEKSTYERNTISYGINLSPQYMYDIYNAGLARMYLGGGPFVSYSYSKNNSDQNNDHLETVNDNTSHYMHSRNSYEAGLNGFIGIEGTITSSIKLFAESELSAGRNWSENKDESSSIYQTSTSKSHQSTTSKDWFYSLENVKIGVGIYF